MPATIARESPDTPDVAALVEELESHLAGLYPKESRHGFSIEKLLAEDVAFFVIRDEGEPAGCGGIKLFEDFGELKRMYVRPRYRGRGFGKLLIDTLADHATQHGITTLRLETGIHQRGAIRLYEREGFMRIPPFGNYPNDPLSLCYERRVW